MAPYEKHMRGGIKAYVALPPLLALIHLIGEGNPTILAAGGVALPFTLVGAMFPDVDSKSSIPFRYFRRGSAKFIAALIAIVLYVKREWLVLIAEWLPLTTAPAFVAGVIYTALVIWMGVVVYRFLYVYNPAHRTVLHQIPAGLMMTTLLFVLLASTAVALSIAQPTAVAGIIAFGFMLGYLSHLYVDTDPYEEKRLLLLRKTYIGERLDERLPRYRQVD